MYQLSLLYFIYLPTYSFIHSLNHRGEKALFIHTAPEKGKITLICSPLGFLPILSECVSAHPASLSPQLLPSPLLPSISGNCRLGFSGQAQEQSSVVAELDEGGTCVGGTILSVLCSYFFKVTISRKKSKN